MSQTLRALTDDFRLTAESIRQFRRDGHVLLPGVATVEEVAAYRPVILAARDAFGAEATPLATDNTLTLSMPQVNVTPEMGTMHFASGSHRSGYLGDLPISDASEVLFG